MKALHSFSVNQLKLWDKCQKRYQYDYIQRLAWPSDPRNFRLGKGVHQLLDYASKGLITKPYGDDKLVNACDEDIAAHFLALQNLDWACLPVIASEWGFSLNVKGFWLYGRIDRIASLGSQIHVIDWKTGTSIPKQADMDWQTRVYLYAVFEARTDLGLSITEAEQLSFTYVQVKLSEDQPLQNVVTTIAYSEEKHEKTALDLALQLSQMAKASHYSLPQICPDRFCPYRSICGIQLTDSTFVLDLENDLDWSHEDNTAASLLAD
jgi:hypothetical protein